MRKYIVKYTIISIIAGCIGIGLGMKLIDMDKRAERLNQMHEIEHVMEALSGTDFTVYENADGTFSCHATR